MQDKHRSRVNREIAREFDTIREVSERTGKCYRTIHRVIKSGKIKAIRCGASVLIPRNEVEKLMRYGW